MSDAALRERFAETIEDEHETVEALLDRLRASGGAERRRTFRALEARLFELPALYGRLAGQTDHERATLLLRMRAHAEGWCRSLSTIARLRPGEERWHRGLTDLGQHLRLVFDEVEYLL